MSDTLRDLVNDYFNGTSKGLSFFGEKAFRPVKNKDENQGDQIYKYTGRPYAKYNVCFDLIGLDMRAHPVVVIEMGGYVYYLHGTSLNTAGANALTTGTQAMVENKYAYIFSPSTPVFDAAKEFYFRYNTVVDTTQVFMMRTEDFLACYDFTDERFENTNYLTDYEKQIVLSQLKDNIENGAYTLTEVFRETAADGTQINRSRLWYAPEKWIEMEHKNRNKRLDIVKDKPDQVAAIRAHVENYLNNYQALRNDDGYAGTLSDLLAPMLEKIDAFLSWRAEEASFFPDEMVGFALDEISLNTMRLYLYQEQITPPQLNHFEQPFYPNLEITEDDAKKLMAQDLYGSLPFLRPLKLRFGGNGPTLK